MVMIEIDSGRVEALMKRCQIGTMTYEAANNLHADCYGMLGRLLYALKEREGDLGTAKRDLGAIMNSKRDVPEEIRDLIRDRWFGEESKP
jgi:hypothetical protein